MSFKDDIIVTLMCMGQEDNESFTLKEIREGMDAHSLPKFLAAMEELKKEGKIEEIKVDHQPIRYRLIGGYGI
jgi:hypothetical protein